MLKYQGAFYIKADPPSGQGSSNPSTPEEILNNKDDQFERKPTNIEPEKKPKPIPYDPRVGKIKAKLKKRRERLVKLRFPLKELTNLVERYQLPAAQIFIRDIVTSKIRMMNNLDQVIEALSKLQDENDDEESTQS